MFRFKVSLAHSGKLLVFVSIHPMFRFKITTIIANLKISEFQYILCFGSRGFVASCRYSCDISFNTSYVSVQVLMKFRKYISYYKVSIHPMFRFKNALYLASTKDKFVSIHPMFRFKQWVIWTIWTTWTVSIHPMFRFKPEELAVRGSFELFQYILCFGSRQAT